MYWFRSKGFAVVVAVLLAGCGRFTERNEPSPPAAAAPASQPAGVRVSIDNFSFSPETITVSAGTTVTWVNHDDVPHTVTANDKRFASKALDTDETYSNRFTVPGEYAYYCAVHPHMTGRVIVK